MNKEYKHLKPLLIGCHQFKVFLTFVVAKSPLVKSNISNSMDRSKNKKVGLVLFAFLLGIGSAASAASAPQIIQLDVSSSSPIPYLQQEREYFSTAWNTQVITNVAQPTLEVFAPEGPNKTKAAVIIAPGGGLYAHSIESEGREVARWLSEKGITAFVLRYRLVPTQNEAVTQLSEEWGKDYKGVLGKVETVLPHSIEDGLAAIRYIRTNAKTYQIDPNKIGMMGFSAGGSVALGVGYQYQASSRPDFLIPVYPWTDAIKIEAPKADAPPMIIICATNDGIGLAQGAIDLYQSYFSAGKNVALHIYSKGEHGFGMKQQGLASDNWIERVHDWLVVENWVP